MSQKTMALIKIQEEEQTNVARQCRICLYPVEYIEGPFCGCKGNHQVVHQKCLFLWVNKKHIHCDSDCSYSECQICKRKIFLKMERKCRLRGLKSCCFELFCSQTQESKIQRLGPFLLLFILIIVFVLMVQSYLTQPDNTNFSISVISGTVLVICCTYMIFKYVFTYKKELVGIWPQSKFRFNESNRIVPS